MNLQAGDMKTTPGKFQRFESEIDYMKKTWGKKLENDPYYNSNLTLIKEDFTFSATTAC